MLDKKKCNLGVLCLSCFVLAPCSMLKLKLIVLFTRLPSDSLEVRKDTISFGKLVHTVLRPSNCGILCLLKSAIDGNWLDEAGGSGKR